MAHGIVDRFGDNLYFIWMIGWCQRAIFSLHQMPFDTTYINYPAGWNLASSEMTPLSIAMALPFSLVSGPILGYNVVVLLTFILSGLFMAIWVHRLTGSTVAALVSGTIFAFAPYRFAHYLGGRLHALVTQWLPVYFMGLFGMLHPTLRGSRKWAVLGGLGLGATALSSQHYLYMALVLSVPFVVAGLILWPPPSAGIRPALTRFLIFAGVAAPLVVAGVTPYLRAAQEGLLPQRGPQAAIRYSASPTDYILPFTGHPVVGRWVEAHFDRSFWEEGSLYLGLTTASLAGLGLLLRKRGRLGSRESLLFLAMGLVALVLSLGVTFHWLSRPVDIHLPPWLSFLQADDGVSIWMPGVLLYRVLPYYSSIRVPMRFGAFVLMFFAALAGSGAQLLGDQLRGRARPIALASLLVLPVMEFMPSPTHVLSLVARPVDVWLEHQPGSGAVVEFPIELARSKVSLYYTLFHGKPFVGAPYDPSQYERLRATLEDFPTTEGKSTLRELGVRFIIVDVAWYESRDSLDDFQVAMQRLGFASPLELGAQTLYLLPEE